MNHKPRILILIGHYLPGHRSGGPLRSISNLVEVLGDEFDFRIITSDHDLGSDKPYSSVLADTWLPVGKAQVMYLSSKGRSLLTMFRLLRSLDYDVLYLNSLFARRFSMLPIMLQKLRLIPRRPTLLAPRGEFSEGALTLKPKRKALYLKISTSLGLYRDIVWHASSQYEAEDIRHALPLSDQTTLIVANPLSIEANAHSSRDFTKILVASGTPGVVQSLPDGGCFRSKIPGQLDVAFLSRVARMKNLDAALLYLCDLSGQVRFDIYGPIEDIAYWEHCRRLIAQLPANVKVTYCGEVQHEAVVDTLSGYHLLLLPTLGENFGHVIHEALSAGCPVLISDRTPWRDLETLGVGWDLPLEEPQRFRAVLQRCVDMDAETHRALSQRAQQYGTQCGTDPAVVEQNRSMLSYMVSLAHKKRERAV